MVPVSPSELLSVVVTEADDAATAIRKTYQEFPILLALFLDYLIDANGNPGPDFVADLCALDCAGAASATSVMAAFPFRASDVKAAVPAPGGSFCESFVRSWQIPKFFYQLVAYIWNEDKTFTDQFRSDMCLMLADCQSTGGGTGGDGQSLSAPSITASDGVFQDKVRINWSPITNATSYDIYRHDINNASTAVVIGNTTSNSYDDTTASPGTTYYYWVKAKNSTRSSAFSNTDTGYAANSLSAITTLVASKGFVESGGYLVQLVFPPIADADSYDIYRSASSDFATASVISGGANRKPFDNSASVYPCFPVPCTQPLFVDNSGELVFMDTTVNTFADYFKKFYYWVVGKKLNGSSVIGVSLPSNMATGWSIGDGSGNLPFAGAHAEVGFDYTVPVGVTRLHIYGYGNGGSGAGGDGSFGGGGGGGAPSIIGELAVVAGKKIRFTIDGGQGSIAGGAGLTNGTDGRVSRIQYDGTGSFQDIVVLDSGKKGVYNGAGGGAGGAGGTITTNQLLNSTVYNGRAGLPGVGNKGGRGGYNFGYYRPTPNHYNGNAQQNIEAVGTSGRGGGGSFPNGITSLATGAEAQQIGKCIIAAYST